MTIRVAAAAVGIAGIIVATNIYYAETLNFLERLRELAHAAIPAILAVALLYHVVKNVLGEKP